MGLHTLQAQSSEVILENMQNVTLPVIVPNILDGEGRKSRNIGSVGHEQVGGRNGGQERTHSVEVFRNGGIAGILGVEGIAGSCGGDIDGQTVLEKEVLRECGREIA